MKFFAVSNYGKWQASEKRERRGSRHGWIRLSVDVFRDKHVGSLPPSEQLGWIAVLIAAKLEDNRIPWDRKKILRSACLDMRVMINLDRLVELGLITVLDDKQTAASFRRPIDIEAKVVTDAPAPAAKKSKAPAGVAKTKAELTEVDNPENRLGVDDVREILGRGAYTLDNLTYFERLRSANYTRDDWREVLVALRDRSTRTARFAMDGVPGESRKGPGLKWALRPGESGGFAAIHEEASQVITATKPDGPTKSYREQVLEEQAARG